MEHYVAFLGGLIGLVFFADQFVKGSAIVAKVYRIPPVIIGVVLLGFGTSLPESFVSLAAAQAGDLDIGAGNILGSNVANLTLVMAAAAIFTRIDIPPKILRKEGLLTLVAAIVLAIFLVNEQLSLLEGLILLGGGIFTLLYIVRGSVKEETIKDEQVHSKAPAEFIRIGLGLLGTVIGAYFTVKGADGLAKSWGITGGFVGFLLIGIGTSLPELVTTASCAKRGETDMIIGNLFGSNIFNSLLVGGLMGVVGPGSIDDSNLTGRGVGFMLLVTFLLLGIAFFRKKLERSEGIILIVIYVVAVAFLGINSAT
tara:strand:+ start:593 stop:1528 length:936 start_codon:yes stop_codon:yes gene_type:complete